MSDTYKVRVMVLDLVVASSPREAEGLAQDHVEDAGLTVLNVEEAEVVRSNYISGSVEKDIYP